MRPCRRSSRSEGPIRACRRKNPPKCLLGEAPHTVGVPAVQLRMLIMACIIEWRPALLSACYMSLAFELWLHAWHKTLIVLLCHSYACIC